MTGDNRNMPRRAPSLGALRAFEAVFRQGSMAGAAEELAVTTSAVSHQVRQLEAEMGVKLVRREGRRVVLTEMGERLFPSLSEAFGALFAAVADVYEQDSAAPLRISMLQTFAVNWFLPRLDRFSAANPGIEVEVSFEPHYVDFARENIDMAIRLSPMDWPDLHEEDLFEDRLTAVCSPAWISRQEPLRSPRCLLKHRLLVSDGRPANAWGEWFAACGIGDPGPLQTMHLGTTHLALLAAANGIGLAIGGLRLMQPMLERGELVTPFATTVPEHGRFRVVCPRGWENRPKIRKLRHWLAREADPRAKS